LQMRMIIDKVRAVRRCGIGGVAEPLSAKTRRNQ
jgi:hypothetical protein